MNGDCWYCTHGWPVKVRAIYDQYAALAGRTAMEFGPAHIVWSDENFDRESIQWCLDHFGDYDDDLDPRQRAAVRASLLELLALPDEVFDVIPADFGPDDDPEDYPPKPGTVAR